MGDEPPPLPPKLCNLPSVKYSEQDQARALEEEKKVLDKHERSHSQRTGKISNDYTQGFSRSDTSTNTTKFEEYSKSSQKTRPIPKPRSISLQPPIRSTEIDNNTQSKNNNKNHNDIDLMSFVSPEKPKSELLEQIHQLNKNQGNLVPSNPSTNFGRNILAPSYSFPYGMNLCASNSASTPLQNTPINFASNQANFMNYNPLRQNILSNLSINSAPFTVPPNIPFNLQETKNPPPLPSRSPVLDTSRLSLGSLSKQTTPTSSKATTPVGFKSPVKWPSKPKYGNLIDLGDNNISPIKKSSSSNVFSTVLEDFDPLVERNKTPPPFDTYSELSDDARELLKYKNSSKPGKDDEQSYYEPVNPFEYMQPSAASTRSDPVLDIYAGLGSPGALGGETFEIPPPLPPRVGVHSEDETVELRHDSKRSTRLKEKKRSATIFEGHSTGGHIQLIKMPALSADKEAVAFWETISSLRSEYVYTDHIGNPGLLHSPCIDSPKISNHSVKLAIHFEGSDPALFTCNLNTGVEHVVMQAMVVLELEGECTDYLLKVRGIDEYLCGETQLGEYEYVHLCIKNDKDILFTLLPMEKVQKSYLRTMEDDVAIKNTTVGNLLGAGVSDCIYYDRVFIAVEAFEKELDRLQNTGFKLIGGTPFHELPHPMRSLQVRQVVKQICALLGKIETIEITKAIDFLVNTCRTIQKSQGVLDGEEEIPGKFGTLSTGSHDSTQGPDQLQQLLLDTLSRIAGAVNNFLIMYTRTMRVDFTVDKLDPRTDSEPHEIISMFDRVQVQISGVHRLSSKWAFDEYFVEAQLCHGTTCVGRSTYSSSKTVAQDAKFYPRIVFDEWLDVGFRVNAIPRESRMVFTLFGLKKVVSENKSDPLKYIREEIGWAAVQMFTFDGFLTSGGFILTLWPMASDKRLGPAPCSSDHPLTSSCPILCVELMEYGTDVFFPPTKVQTPTRLNFEDLDVNTQQQLSDIIERDIFTFNKSCTEEREILWEKRHYLYHEPDALAKVLLAAHSWDVSCLPDLHALINNWTPPAPADALHLLLPSFPDTIIRNKAVSWIRGLGSDELIAYLPQLVQAIKHEAWDVSKLTELLLERALTSPRLAHHLYWLLNQCLPLQSNMAGHREVVSDARYARRLNMVTRALMTICGASMESRLLRQEAFLRTLYETALAIKDSKDSNRMVMLHHRLEDIHANLKECHTSLPLSPSLEVSGLDIESCSYYTSFTVPLRLAFLSSEQNTEPIHTIFKVGDDLRQDMLVIQMIRLMDKLWLKEGLDLRIITFDVVPTGDKIGILEMVNNAETLRKIQTENTLAGCFEERPIADWLAKHNTSQLEYHRAVSNFTASCAGYCVATYILGICDRHNDNIMLKTSGHLFHIDFGKFLGDVQKFGNIKRDRTPFVLTADMAYVINGGEKASDKFQSFVDLCCNAFNIIRQKAHLILYLFALMASSGIPGVTSDAVLYVEKALLQDRTNAEAGAFFAKMIQESLKNWFTQVNFFIHNLAQLRFSSEAPDGDLLSFVPRKFTMAEDGRIAGVRLYSFQKRYNPIKYYVYILKVSREEQKEPYFLFRSYKEFSEFHQKLCYVFPLARIHSLPKGVQIGRSEVKAVAEKRKFDIELFLSSLFGLSEEIAHSDLVYTFLHPILRDQEDTDIHIKKLKPIDSRSSTNLGSERSPSIAGASSSVTIQGQVKVNVQYVKGQLQIIVQYVRNLSKDVGNEPSPYVKLYLLPDHTKKTKRKTKVVKKSCHPTFMEMITYRMSLEIIRQKTLEVSVWSEDRFSENSYLGSAYLHLSKMDFKKEFCEWLSLEHNIRTAREHIFQSIR